MKLYTQYIKERENKECIYDEHSFIIYKIYGDEMSVIDMFTSEEKRGSFGLIKLIKKLYKVMEHNQIKKVYGFTDPDTIGWKKSEKIMINYGFKKIECDSEYNHYILELKKENNGK